MTRQMTAREAANLVPDGAVVAVNSSSGLCCPDAVLKGLGERFDDEGAPRNLTSVSRLHSALTTVAGSGLSKITTTAHDVTIRTNKSREFRFSKTPTKTVCLTRKKRLRTS